MYKTKKWVLVLGIILSLWYISGVIRAEEGDTNLIINSGFEEYKDGRFAPWKFHINKIKVYLKKESRIDGFLKKFSKFFSFVFC